MTVAMHAERTDDPDVVRWVIRDHPAGSRPAVRVDRRSLPRHPIADRLLTELPEITAVDIDGRGVTVRKRPEAEWPVAAARVQAALRRILDEVSPTEVCPAEQRRAEPTSSPTAREAGDLIQAAVGAAVASHGGRIEVTEASAEKITVRLQGACHGCPAARLTLARAVTAELRARFPGVGHIDIAS